jgi:hypothetical protein
MIISVEEFVLLRNSLEPLNYNRAADEDAPLEVWLQVIDQFPDMRQWVAHNKTVPISILEILAKDLDSDVRFAVAMKRKLTPELFELLARDPNESVRQRIAYNAKTPKWILQELLDDTDSLVREAARSKLELR